MTPPQHNANRPVGTNQMVCLAHQASFATTGVEGSLVSGFDGSGETVEWQFPGLAVNGKPWGSSAALATDGDRVFVCQVHIDGQTVAFATMALDAATGGLEWMVREPLGDFDPKQHSSELWRHVTLCQPAVAGRTLVVGYGTSTQLGDDHQGPSDGTLLGLSTRTGTEHWRRPIETAPSDLSVSGNRVYVGGARGELTAVSLSGASDQLADRRLE